jgi:type II secretory pathway pseudopilin PulG
MRIGLLVIAALALVGFVVVAFVLPRMAGEDAKQAAQALIAGAESAQREVAAAAEKAGTLSGSGKDVKLAPKNDAKHGELKWLVSEGGAIRAWNERNAIEVTFMPQLQAGKTVWTCRGYPVNAMPASCGGR